MDLTHPSPKMCMLDFATFVSVPLVQLLMQLHDSFHRKHRSIRVLRDYAHRARWFFWFFGLHHPRCSTVQMSKHA